MRARNALIVALALAGAAVGAAEVYRWVDADGKVHFSDSPPPGIAAERLAIKSAPTDPAAVDLAETTREVRANQAAADEVVKDNLAREAAAKAEKKAADCDAARKRFEDIQYSRKFSSKDKDGKEIWLSGADADALKQKAKADVDAKCGG